MNFYKMITAFFERLRPATTVAAGVVFVKAAQSWGEGSKKIVIGEVPVMTVNLRFLPINFVFGFYHYKEYGSNTDL